MPMEMCGGSSSHAFTAELFLPLLSMPSTSAVRTCAEPSAYPSLLFLVEG